VEDEVRLLLDSLKIYSPSTRESRLSKLLQRRMRELGFSNVHTDGAGNAIGEVGSGRPHLLLCGHMDTIPGFLKVRQVDGKVYGRGAADAKSPMCAMISAASGLGRDSPLHITVACVTREEGDSLGVHTLIDAGGDYDAAVFGEPGGANRVAVGYRGRIEAEVTVTTAGGHAASPWANESAVEQGLALFDQMRGYEKKLTKGEDHFRSLNISLTLIRGGSYSNVIPRKCTMTLDIRLPPGLASKQVRSDLLALMDERAARNPGVKFGMDFEEPTEPYEAPTDSTILRAFQRSILKTLKTKPVFTHKTGTGDMNTMAERMGIPCVTYGPGDSKLEHTDGEYVEVSDYLNSISVLKGAAQEFRGLSGAR
jgi:[amino group carrier protein]-lysine/ornithine hydrolase